MKAKRIYNPSRIVALAVIGVMLVGLTYIRFAPGDGVAAEQQLGPDTERDGPIHRHHQRCRRTVGEL